LQQAAHFSMDEDQLMNLVGLKELIQKPSFAIA
jgi:hypothetical protein